MPRIVLGVALQWPCKDAVGTVSISGREVGMKRLSVTPDQVELVGDYVLPGSGWETFWS
jgi:hypothetical protein